MIIPMSKSFQKLFNVEFNKNNFKKFVSKISMDKYCNHLNLVLIQMTFITHKLAFDPTFDNIVEVEILKF
jgi:hypothetical protein